MRPALMHGLAGKGYQHAYNWYFHRLYCLKTEEAILEFPVESGTIGELAQANVLGITMTQLRIKKCLYFAHHPLKKPKTHVYD